jgi:beta-glucosidase
MMCVWAAALSAAPPGPASAADPASEGVPENGAREQVVYAGQSVAPWRLYLGSAGNWSVPVEAPETTSRGGRVIAVRTVAGDSGVETIQAEWGGGAGQVYWQANTPRDFTALAASGGALSVVARIDRQPAGEVRLMMGCGFPCAGTLNLTRLLQAVPPDQWFRMSFSLSCFENAGARLGRVVAPMVVATDGALALSIADVRLVTDPPAESLVPCN